MRKAIACILIGACILVLLWASPFLWDMRDGFTISKTTGMAAVSAYLLLLGFAAFALTPIWIIGVWLLWADRRKPLSNVQFDINRIIGPQFMAFESRSSR